MAKSKNTREPIDEFRKVEIIRPGINECVHVDANGKIRVRATNPDDHNVFGRIHDWDPLTGTLGGHHGEVQLLLDAITNEYSELVDAGPVPNPTPAGNNKVVVVRDADTANEISNPFVALPFGSGTCPSGGSYSGNFVGDSVKQQFAQKNRPIPASLTLQADSGDSTDLPASKLVHVDDAKLAGTWLSAPFVDSAENTTCYWVLTKPSPNVWMLALRRGNAVVVSYHYNAGNACDCTFPLRMQLANEPHAGRWPQIVRVAQGA